MTINYRSLNLQPGQTYVDYVVLLLRAFEQPVPFVYDDRASTHNPTIGDGINLRGRDYLALTLVELDVFTASDAAESIARASLGLPPESVAERNARYDFIINEFAAVIANHPLSASGTLDPNNLDLSEVALNQALTQLLQSYVPNATFELSDAQSAQIVRQIIQGYTVGADLLGNGAGHYIVGSNKGKEDLLDRRLLVRGIQISKSTYEYSALLSLSYANLGLIGDGLLNALATGDRAEAWFEIRYRSNSAQQAANIRQGIAKRRYYEAQLFGLYDVPSAVQPVDSTQAVQAYRMLELHRHQIEQYERQFGAQIAAANSDYQLSGSEYEVETLNESLQPAVQPLIDWINSQLPAGSIQITSSMIDSPLGIHLSPGRNRASEQFSATYKAQLNARRYSAPGSSTELEIRNILIGEEGNDTLEGGKGDDVLLGGFAEDRYVFKTGDGQDIIFDQDGTAEVIRNGTQVVLGYKSGVDTWTQPGTAGVTVTLRKLGAGNIADLELVFSDSQTDRITIKDFDFTQATADFYGIRLIDAPSSPTQEVRTFFGDKQDWDSDPNEPGIQTQLDVFDNTIRADGQGDPARPDLDQPDREDFFYGSDANEVERFLTAGGNDTVYADGAASTTSTLGGEDVVEAGAGSDVVAGGAGNDWVEGGTEDDILGGNEGNDTLFAESSNAGALTIDLAIAQGEYGPQRAGQGDLMSGDAGDDVLLSDAGADYLSGGIGEDIIVGGAGDDTIYGDGSVVSAVQGWSVVRTRTDAGSTVTFDVDPTGINLVEDDALGGLDVIYGGAGDDWIFAGAADDYVEGGIGDDVLFGETGHDVLLGGEGNDFLAGDSASVDAAGLSGDDYLVGGAGDDELLGGKGNDYLDGGEGFDRLSGGEGNDTLVGGTGVDVLAGGAGKDRYVFNAGDGTEIIDDAPNGPDDLETSVLVLGPGITQEQVKFRPDSLVVDLGNGDSIQFLHFNIEDPLSTPVLDAIEFRSGGFMALEDVLEQGFDIDGTEGDDALFGTPYADLIDAKGGNDTVSGRAGDDTILGGAGEDWLEGGLGNDVLDGGTESDQLAGGWGDDTLQGGDGDDALAGEGGNDTLDGGDGADSLVGHDGDDVLNGGTGDDLLMGNEGSDTYTFAVGDGVDLIDEQAMLALGVADEAGIDVVRFDATVTPGQVTFARSANGDLTIRYGAGDAVTISGQYSGAAQAIERVEFEDGTVIDKAALNGLAVAPIEGTPGNDTLSGTRGDDTLSGGAGADTYALYLGMGRDTIVDASPSGAEIGTLALAEGLTLNSLKARQVGEDLAVDIRGTDDGVLIQGYFAPGSTQNWQITEFGGTPTAIQDLIDRPDPYANDVALGAREDFRQALLSAWATETVAPVFPTHALVFDAWTQTKSYVIGSGGTTEEILPRVVTYNVNGYGVREGSFFVAAPLVHHAIDVLAASQTSDAPTITAQSQAQSSSQFVNYGVDPGPVIPGYGYQSQSSTSTFLTSATSYNIIESHSTSGWAPIVLDPGSTTGYPATLTIEQISEIRTVEDISGGASANVIYGAGGASVGHVALIDAGEGNDEVHAGPDDFAYGNEGDDAIYGGALVYGGNGADTLQGGAVQYGGAGNDTLSGGAFMMGGSGDDTMTGGAGATTFFFDPTEVGADVVQDVAGIPIDDVATWYYQSIGVMSGGGAEAGLWTLTGSLVDGSPTGDSLLALQELFLSPEDYPGYESLAITDIELLFGEVPFALFFYLSVDDLRADLAAVGAPYRPDEVRYLLPLDDLRASEYGALERFYDAGLVERDTVEFGAGVTLNDLALTWNIVDVQDPITGLDVPHAALELSWGAANSVSVAIPRVADLIGTGIEQFRFADGTVVSMAEMLELAPQPGPAIPVDGTAFDDGLFGTDDNEILTGYAGNDSLDGGKGGDRYVYTAGETGIDNLDDSGPSTEAYLDWYYRSQGLENWRLRPEYQYPGQYRIFRSIEGGYEYFTTFEGAANAAAAGRNQPVHFIASPAVLAPLVTRNDAATIDELTQAGVLDRDVVSFGAGLALVDLDISVTVFGLIADAHPEQPWYGGGTLSVRWNGGTAGFDLDVPDVNFGYSGDGYFDDGWSGYALGEGVESFEFSDGSSYSLEQVLQLATVVPIYGYPFTRDSGDQVIEGPYTGVDFAANIAPSDIDINRNGTELVFNVTGNFAIGRIPNWYSDPAGVPQWEFRFADGTVYDTDTVTRMGHTVLGSSGANPLVGDPQFASAIYGFEGDDSLSGGAANDLLNGGPGHDILYGHGGNDIYEFGHQSNVDAVNEFASVGASGNDVIRFAADVTPSDVSVVRNIDSINLLLSGSGAQALLASWFTETGGTVESFEFADGTTWTSATVESMLPVQAASSGNDVLLGLTIDDVLDGLEGDDSIYGFAGNDTLKGGGGNDLLHGQAGDDIYEFGLGDGIDKIFDLNGSSLLRLGPGIDAQSVHVTRDENALYLVIGGTGDRVGIGDWFYELAQPQMQVVFSDQTTWTESDMEIRLGLVPATEFGDLLWGSEDADLLNGLGGPDQIYGNGGDDVIDGGDDADYVESGAGNDILRGGAGDDELNAWDAGNNLIEAGAGNDYVYFEGHSLVIGGLGDDWIDVYGFNGVVAFNPGDGADTMFVNDSFTLSIGGGVTSADLSLTADGDDVVVNVGALDSVRLKREGGAYENSWPTVLLQLFGSAHLYNFGAALGAFDSARASDPSLTEWELGSVLPGYLFLSSETSAVGGAIAHQYAITGSTSQIGDAQIVTFLEASGFGAVLQPMAFESSNSAPALDNPLADQFANEDEAFTFAVPAGTFSDPDAGDVLTFTATQTDGSALPAWLSFDTQTQTFSGTPLQADVGAIDVKVIATDTANASISDSFLVTVANTNDAPTVANPIADQSAAEDSAFSFTVPANTFADEDVGDDLSYSATVADGSALPSWLSFNAATQTFTGTPNNADVGSMTVKVTATDGADASASGIFAITVSNTNDAPVLVNAIADQMATENEPFAFTLPADTFSDADVSDSLTYSASLADGTSLPGWLSFDGETRTFSGTPPDTAAGVLTMRITVVDGEVASAFDDFDLDIANVIHGTESVDNLVGGELRDVMYGFGDADWLDGGPGADVMIGGDGADVYVVDNVDDVVIESAGGGVDLIRSIVSWELGPNIERLILEKNSPAIYGTGNELDNFLYGSNQANVLVGGEGDDYLEGNFGADTLIGGPGNDTYMVDDARYQIIEYGDEGIDWVWMGDAQTSWTLGDNLENLRLNGGAFDATGNELDNILVGSTDTNTLTALGGNDTLDGFWGADTLIGGTGDDHYLVYGFGEQVIENADEGIDSVSSWASWTLSGNLENLTLAGTSAISGTGNALDNVLTGNAGSNILYGGAGNDTLTGGDGNDYLLGESGLDILVGGTGDDVYYTYSSETLDQIVEYENEGVDKVVTDVSWSLVGTHLENVTLVGTGSIDATGNDSDNVLLGYTGDNILIGNAGDDRLQGRGGTDTLIGGVGNDTYELLYVGDENAQIIENAGEGIDTVVSWTSWTLGANLENLELGGTSAYNINGTGNELDNVLTGNAGSNILTGGAGNDVLDGGGGSDSFIGGAGDDIYFVDSTGDWISESSGAGIDTVNSMIAYTLGSNLENLVLNGAGAINGTGNSLANELTGNDGSNVLTGLDGADTMDGRAGSDTLVGGKGNDTYLLGRGYGGEVIQENDNTSGNTDVARYLADIAPEQIWFQRSGQNLVATVIGTPDQFTVQNWYSGSKYRVEQFRTDDGQTLLQSQVQNLVDAMASFAPPAPGQTDLPPDYAAQLNPVIAANWQ